MSETQPPDAPMPEPPPLGSPALGPPTIESSLGSQPLGLSTIESPTLHLPTLEATPPGSPALSGGGFSAWWLLLILPIAPLVGWGIGQLPSAAPRPTEPTVERMAAPARAPLRPVERSPASGTAGSTGIARVEEVREPERAPTEAVKPSPENERPELSQWTTLGVAMDQSERNGKPVLIDFNAEWCGPCRRMKEEVFDDWTRSLAVRTAVIPVSIVDRRREEGSNPAMIENLQTRFAVGAFPTLVVFSPATGRVIKTEGFPGAEQTVQWITEAAAAVR